MICMTSQKMALYEQPSDKIYDKHSPVSQMKLYKETDIQPFFYV